MGKGKKKKKVRHKKKGNDVAAASAQASAEVEVSLFNTRYNIICLLIGMILICVAVFYISESLITNETNETCTIRNQSIGVLLGLIALLVCISIVVLLYYKRQRSTTKSTTISKHSRRRMNQKIKTQQVQLKIWADLGVNHRPAAAEPPGGKCTCTFCKIQRNSTMTMNGETKPLLDYKFEFVDLWNRRHIYREPLKLKGNRKNRDEEEDEDEDEDDDDDVKEKVRINYIYYSFILNKLLLLNIVLVHTDMC